MPVLTVPEPAEQHLVSMSDGAQISLRRHGNPDGPRLALSHGNGLAIDAYLPTWSLLLDRYDVILFDLRNHGRNPLHTAEGHTWERITRDMPEILGGIARAFGERPVTGVFHSLSSVASIRHVLDGGTGWSSLILVDPPFYPRPGHDLIALQEDHLERMTRLARRRPESYGSVSEFAEQLAGRPQFSRWCDGMHELFAATTLRLDKAAGRWVLRCPRDYEAHIFETNRDAALWPHMAEGMPVPVSIIGADPDLDDRDSPSQVCRALALELGLPYEAVPGTTHLLQMEEPRAFVAALERLLRSQ